MRRLLLMFLIVLTGCIQEKPTKYTVKSSTDDDMFLNDLNASLDSMTAEVEYILVRGEDCEKDTIIDHVRYIFTKEE